MTLDQFQPAVAAWFQESFPSPTPCQQSAWEAIKARRHTLIAAPTGSGKTLAAFLASIDELVRLGARQGLADETRVVYISPLKALSNDIQKNLELPLAGIHEKLFEAGHTNLVIRSMARTGDTSAAARAAMARLPPHILVTTPESFYILLTSDSGRRMLKTARTVIVDEIHAVAGSKRGSHLALSLERLERLTEGRLVRIGLSATQKPIEEVARFLTGGSEDCRIIDAGHRRQLDLAVELPDSPLEAVLSQQAAKEIYDRMTALIEAHRTTLIFVNTRRMAERVAHCLSERIGEANVTSHHGSLSREHRLSAESRLKAGRLKALVATASLELGIDIGDVDLVCQLGTTGSIATFLQRIGRSGHRAGGVPKGRLFPTSRDELIEGIAVLDAIRRGELDALTIPEQPLDVLAQQIIAMTACEDFGEDELYACICRAYPYRNLSRSVFNDLVRMVAEGFSTRRGTRGAYLHRDGIHRKLRGRRGARLTAITCGGAIPDSASYRVILEPGGEVVGTVEEDFAIESLAGDIFQLGNTSWRVLRLEADALRVEDARGQPPSIPFWFGEAPGRTPELSYAVSRLREEIIARGEHESVAAERWLQALGISAPAAKQAVDYLLIARSTLGVMPSFDTVVVERFFDEAGGMHLVIHAPFGSRVNRAWGLALRKRFCRTFNFELQAAATENAIILSLGASQRFPLHEAAHYLHSGTVRDLLIQALLAAPMFTIRWRWNATCSLAIKRFLGGKKAAPYLVRIQAEDLLTSVFPDQLACQENIVGDREVPDHCLVHQTIQDCLTEVMDIDRLIEVLKAIETGAIKVIARDLTEPSPLAAEILNSKVYTFLDGAPLEERRTRAVASRRWLDPAAAGDLGKLDLAAIQRVRDEAWPEASSADELHDALHVLGFIDAAEAAFGWDSLFAGLVSQGRATRLVPAPGKLIWVAAERLPWFAAIHPGLRPDPALELPDEFAARPWQRETAIVELVRARLAGLGPVQAQDLAASIGLSPTEVEAALATLENEGFVLRGLFTPGAKFTEWCERRLLARIHRYTINRLRKEIEPVSSADFMRFLFRWQYVHPEHGVKGAPSLSAVLDRLEGFETAACAWEGDILPARLEDYEPAWLDSLCLSGKMIWTRLTPAKGGMAPVKSSPIALLPRRHWAFWRSFSALPDREQECGLSANAARILETLDRRGALFFEEMADLGGLLKTQLEKALAELATRGLIHSDSFNGLRALLVPEEKKQRHKALVLENAGRWTLTRRFSGDDAQTGINEHTGLEPIAKALLRRYGVIFRVLLTRETAAPPWQSLLRIYRQLEARGEIRGGRFIAGHYGEQFALPEAVETLRTVRKQSDEAIVTLSAADPLNLAGIVTPGNKISALPGNRLLFRGGSLLAILAGKETRFLEALSSSKQWEIKNQLLRRNAPPQLRAYLGTERQR
jgi:ATP-dependent Lhr-like helicase